MRPNYFWIPMLALSVAAGLACEEPKPLPGTEEPTQVKGPREYLALLNESGIDRAKLPHVEMVVKGKGKVVFELVPQLAPKTCARIMQLIDQRYYDGQRFHRVENWVVQWGDPQSKEPNWKELHLGTKGTGTIIDFDDNWIRQDRGVLAMARTSEEKNGDSQMYVLKRSTPQLTHDYVAFGWTIEGMDVMDKIAVGDVIESMKITQR